MHKHGNSIYFTRDNMVCFPKSGHIYIYIYIHTLCTYADFREGAPNITTLNTVNVNININLKCECSIRDYKFCYIELHCY